MSKEVNKALTREEKNICWLTWGCIPVDTEFVHNSNLFKVKRVEYEKYRHLWESSGKNASALPIDSEESNNI